MHGVLEPNEILSHILPENRDATAKLLQIN